jgi:hypothetical protein
LCVDRYPADKGFDMDLPFEIMVSGAEDQEQMVVTAITRLPMGGARLSVLRGENEPAKDLRYKPPGNSTYFQCEEGAFPRFAPDEWSCDTSKYWNKDGWCAFLTFRCDCEHVRSTTHVWSSMCGRRKNSPLASLRHSRCISHVCVGGTQ